MGTNAFEKPIAANPISQFVELPLQFIDQALERRQEKFDTNKAKVGAMEDLWLNTKARSVDTKRHQEILAEKDAMVDDVVDRVGGDYGRVGGYVDKMERDLRRELTSGELGTINQNYTRAAEYRADLGERKAKGEVSDSGYALGMQSLQKGKTSQLDSGAWSQFNGYVAQDYYDVNKALIDYSKNIKDQYSADGTVTYMTKNRAANFIYEQAIGDSKLLGSLSEELVAHGLQPTQENLTKLIQERTDPVAGKLAFQKNDMYKKMQLNKARAENKTSIITGGYATAPTLKNGENYKGGAGGWFADQWRKINGASNDEYNAWAKSEVGKNMKARYETGTGKTLSDDAYTAMAQFDEFSAKVKGDSSKVNQIETYTDYNKLKSIENSVINPNTGHPRVTSDTIFDSEGNKVSHDDIGGLGDGGKSTLSYIGNVVGSKGSYPPGTRVISDGKDQYYIMPNEKTEITSADGAIWHINNSRYTASGSGSVVLSGAAAKSMSVPDGTYKVTRNPKVKVSRPDGSVAEIPGVIVSGSNGVTRIMVETPTGFRSLSKN